MMGWLGAGLKLTRVLALAPQRARALVQAASPREAGPAARPFEASSFQPAAGREDTHWWQGRPLSEARNAHSTNTREDLEAALAQGYNFLEGDIRTELNPPHALEMRHDTGHESGDNLTLREWLEAGKASGRGLKLDVKEGQRIGDVLDTVDRVGVPGGRLMFNYGDGDMARWGEQTRRRFPEATLAINPADTLGTQHNSGPLQDWQVDRMLAHAQKVGQPVTFVVRYDRLTDAALRRLEEAGTVSVWNSPSRSGVDDVAALTRELRARGVQGVIDLRPSMGAADMLREGADKAWNWLRTKLS